MRISCIGAALMMVGLPATARGPTPIAATNAERDTGFVDRADCEKALGGGGERKAKINASDQADQRGSLFNRTAGNISRCELADGEYQIVVYPGGSPATAAD